MPDENVSFENLKILIKGNLPSNMLSYAAEQALSGDQVVYRVVIHQQRFVTMVQSKLQTE